MEQKIKERGESERIVEKMKQDLELIDHYWAQFTNRKFFNSGSFQAMDASNFILGYVKIILGKFC